MKFVTWLFLIKLHRTNGCSKPIQTCPSVLLWSFNQGWGTRVSTIISASRVPSLRLPYQHHPSHCSPWDFSHLTYWSSFQTTPLSKQLTTLQALTDKIIDTTACPAFLYTSYACWDVNWLIDSGNTPLRKHLLSIYFVSLHVHSKCSLYVCIYLHEAFPGTKQ